MLNTTTTGNGYKAGISSGVGVRPSNFYIKPGETSLDELFNECGNGFYLTEVQGLHAGINVINGDFSLQAQGYEIVDRKLGKPVNLIVASGNIKKLLNEVISIGNDLNFKTGSVGAPSLLVSEVSISGK
jgi:PmbA protein